MITLQYDNRAIHTDRRTPAVQSWLRTAAGSNRRGSILVMAAVASVILIGFTAFAVDLGYIRLALTELRNAADAASLAAAGTLRRTASTELATEQAVAFAALNDAGGRPILLDPISDVTFGRRVHNEQSGQWQFIAGETPFDSVRVRARRTPGSASGPLDLFFARALGKDSIGISASATATILPRDIALVIDLSGSMLYDSTLKREVTTVINNQDIWVALGSPTYGRLNSWGLLIHATGTEAQILEQLELDTVPYPYSGAGSWSRYISYVKNDSKLPSTYENKYGLKTWVDYLLQDNVASQHANTPALAGTPEQPVTALKDAVDFMMDYLQLVFADDHVSLSTYDEGARIEFDLIADLSAIKSSMRGKQAGHYARRTNIGLGIRRGRESLTGVNARPTAQKVLVVFTDGLANRPTDKTTARQLALDEAALAAAEDIIIHTITFTSGADQALMAEIASMGHGIHFHVPSNNVAQYRDGLIEVLLTISSMRQVVLTE